MSTADAIQRQSLEFRDRGHVDTRRRVLESQLALEMITMTEAYMKRMGLFEISDPVQGMTYRVGKNEEKNIEGGGFKRLDD